MGVYDTRDRWDCWMCTMSLPSVSAVQRKRFLEDMIFAMSMFM